MERFITIGYYICEAVPVAEHLAGISEKILSVSECIGTLHPARQCFFVDAWRKGEERKYREHCKMTDEQYQRLICDTYEMNTKNRLGFDGRFSALSDACHFYNEYFRKTDCLIVSVSTNAEYLSVLKAELSAGRCDTSALTDRDDNTYPLGYDILGFEGSMFHSFLCNSLNMKLPDVRFNSLGLIDNDFSEVVKFAREIHGMGEPVEWIPCKIGKC